MNESVALAQNLPETISGMKQVRSEGNAVLKHTCDTIPLQRVGSINDSTEKKSRRKRYGNSSGKEIGGIFGSLIKVDHFGIEEQFGETVYKDIVSPGDKIVALTGEPGIGKTTNAQQLANKLRQDGKRVIEVRFDDIKDELEKEFGTPCASWTHTQWDIFSHELTNRALNPSPPDSRRHKRKYQQPDTIVIVDAVAMGKRGGLLMETLAQKSKDTPGSVKVLRFASIEDMQLEAGMQREKVMKSPDNKVVDMFATIYKTVFEYAETAISNSQLGRIIKEKVGKSASLAAIVKIIKETREYVKNLLTEIPYLVVNAIELPASLLHLSKDAQHRIKRNIFAWLEHFSQLGFAPGSAHVVLNNKREKVQHYLQSA